MQLKLVGLPRRYDDFGPKGFELGFAPFLDDPSFVPYPVGEAVAEVFFDPSGVDHPVSDSITMTQDELRVPPGGRPVGEGFPVLVYETSGALEPNWAYYYSQIAQDLAEETLVLRYVSDAEETPVPFTAATPKMSDWLYFQGNPSTVWMARGMFGLVVNSLGEETLGINAFANIIAHESRHIDDVYLMSDPANCGPYWARSLEPEGLLSGWGVSANAVVVSKDDWAFNRYEERVIEGVFNEGLDVLLDDDGDGMCNNGDELPKEFNELEIRADDSLLFPACTKDLWEEPECDLARLDREVFNDDERALNDVDVGLAELQSGSGCLSQSPPLRVYSQDQAAARTRRGRPRSYVRPAEQRHSLSGLRAGGGRSVGWNEAQYRSARQGVRRESRNRQARGVCSC